MFLISENYLLVIYLLIRLKKTVSFLRNRKNTDRNGINEQNAHHTLREKGNFRKHYW